MPVSGKLVYGTWVAGYAYSDDRIEIVGEHLNIEARGGLMFVYFDDVSTKFCELAEQLKKCRDPETRKKILAQMRMALVEAERPTNGDLKAWMPQHAGRARQSQADNSRIR